MMIPFDIDQAGWGSVREYGDGDLSGYFDATYLLIHWGGTTRQVSPDNEEAVLRGWQRYHMGSRGMRDIAYSYAVGDSGLVYRLRGLNPNGSNRQSLVDPNTGRPWNNVTVAVVWIGGNQDLDGPSDAAYRSFENIADAAGLPIVAHFDMKQTACPGPELGQWAHTYEIGDSMFTHYKVGAEYAEWESVSWWLYMINGGTIDPNANSSQIQSQLPWKTNVRLVQNEDFDLIASLIGSTERDEWGQTGLYRFGKELAALRQRAYT